MPLPETVQVKLSSEAAEAISLTPVVVQNIATRELIEHMLGVTGKDEQRIREILIRGTLVSGASRFRWAGWEADADSIRALLATFPDPDPARAFLRDRCIRAILRSSRTSIEIPRSVGGQARFFRRSSFWDVLMEVASASGLHYAGYSYRERADRYTGEITADELRRLRAGSGLVRYTSLRDQVRTVPFASIELYVER
jgi:hypothetical protein